MAALLSTQAFLTSFDGKKTKEFISRFQSFCMISVLDRNITADCFGVHFLNIHAQSNRFLSDLFKKFKRDNNLETIIPDTVSITPFLNLLRERYDENEIVKRSELLKRINSFKFKELTLKSYDALERLLDEFASVNANVPISDDILCQTFHTAISTDLAKYLLSDSTFNPDNVSHWKERIKQICMRSEAFTKRTSGLIPDDGDVEINTVQKTTSKRPLAKKKSTPVTSTSKQTPGGKCFFCGGNPHKTRDDCPAKGKKCSYCSKEGHFESVCQSKLRGKKANNLTANTNVETEELEVLSFTAMNPTTSKPVHVNVLQYLSHLPAGCEKEEGLADSGCDTFLIPYKYKKHMYNVQERTTTFHTALARETVVSFEGKVDIIFQTDKGFVKATVECCTQKNAHKLLLPSFQMDTTTENKYMLIKEHVVPLTTVGQLHYTDVYFHKVHQTCTSTTESKSAFSREDLTNLSIFPLSAAGEPLREEELASVTGLLCQTLHARTHHYGARTLKRTLKAYFNIEVPLNKLEQYLSTCKVCACKVTYKKPLVLNTHSTQVVESAEDVLTDDDIESLRETKGFNHRLHQDCKHLSLSSQKNKVASIIVDSHSSFTSVCPMTSANSKETTAHLLQWIDQHGKPFSVQTDNGPEFQGLFSELLNEKTILHRTSIPYRPQQQGKVERFNREIAVQTSLFLRSHNLPEKLWDWAIHGVNTDRNKLPNKDNVIPYEAATGKRPSLKLLAGDRVAFKPRSVSDATDDPRTIDKLLVGTFVGEDRGKKCFVLILTPNQYNYCIVPKEELKILPISLEDCLRLVKEAFSEPDNIDNAVRLCREYINNPSSRISLPTPKFTQLVYYTQGGKTHLEVTKTELDLGSHDEAIISEFTSFIENGVFGPQMTAEEAKKQGFTVVSFKGIATWKLTDTGRKAKWRGCCRGFEDNFEGDVDTDAPSPTKIKILFVIALSKGYATIIVDGKTAFLQVPIKQERKVAVRLTTRIPKAIAHIFTEGGIYPLRKFLYGLDDSPREWVLYLKSKMIEIGWQYLGDGIYKKTDAYAVCYYDDIAVLALNPQAEIDMISKVIKLGDPVHLRNSTTRYVGVSVTTRDNQYTFSINDYLKGVTSTCKADSLKINTSTLRSLQKMEGEVNSQFMRDVGALGWAAAHHHKAAFPYSFFSRYNRGINTQAHRMVKHIIEHLQVQDLSYTLDPIDLQSTVMLVFTDASNDKHTGDSQLGIIIQMTDEKLKNVHKEVRNMTNVITFKSRKGTRIVRASGQAELLALSSGVDIAVDINHLLQQVELQPKWIFLTDSKVVVDQLKNPYKADPHFRCNVLFTAEQLSFLKAQVELVSTRDQKADELTHFFK